jgi:hypothetical protein
MAQVNSENSTAMPVISTRRRFLSQAAGVAAGGAVLALAAELPAPAVAAPATDDRCHLPPRADLLPRRFSSMAIDASVSAPVARMVWTTGIRVDANSSAARASAAPVHRGLPLGSEEHKPDTAHNDDRKAETYDQ